MSCLGKVLYRVGKRHGAIFTVSRQAQQAGNLIVDAKVNLLQMRCIFFKLREKIK